MKHAKHALLTDDEIAEIEAGHTAKGSSRSASAVLIVSALTGQKRVIPVPVLFLEMLGGDYTTAALLTQLIYWQNRSKTGWVYKTYRAWQEEVYLGKKAVSRASACLRSLGWLETKIKKANGAPTVHYKLDMGAITQSIISFVSDGKCP